MHIQLLMLVLALARTNSFASEKMVYMHEIDGQSQIVLADSDATNSRAITNGAGLHLYPDISADGTTVVYATGPDQDHLEIVTQDLSLGQTRIWSQHPGFNVQPRFSRDGRYLAYSGSVGPDGAQRIAWVELATGKMEVLSTNDNAYFPHPSSDGRLVVFQTTDAQKRRCLVLYNRAENSSKELTCHEGNAMAPAFSVDDNWVAYSAEVNGNWEIFVMDLNTQRSVRITNHLARDLSPAFKADGSLVFSSSRGASDSLRLYEVKISSLDQKSFPIRPLTRNIGKAYGVGFSGDLNLHQGSELDIPSPARSSFGTVRIGDRIYVAGGHQGRGHTYPPESFLSRLDFFNLKTKKWEQTSPRPVAAHGYALASHGKFIYAFGGFTFSAEHTPGWKSIDNIDRLDTETGEWTTIGHLQAPRSSNVAVTVDDRVYLIGGWDSTPRSKNDTNGFFHRKIEIFDFSTEKVSTAPYELPDPLRRAFTGVEKDGKIILIGGISQGGEHFSLIDRVTQLDPKTGTWQELSHLPFPTFAPAAGVLGNSVIVFGGLYAKPDDYVYVNHIYAMDLDGQKWRHTGRHLRQPKGFPMVVRLDEKTLGILGGHVSENGEDGPTPAFETVSEIN